MNRKLIFILAIAVVAGLAALATPDRAEATCTGAQCGCNIEFAQCEAGCGTWGDPGYSQCWHACMQAQLCCSRLCCGAPCQRTYGASIETVVPETLALAANSAAPCPDGQCRAEEEPTSPPWLTTTSIEPSFACTAASG